MSNPRHAIYGLRFSLLAAPALMAAPLLVQAQTADQTSRLEEILVTAQKREQNIQDVPVSISALSADTIAANRIGTVNDLSGVTPNLTIRPGAGGGRNPQYSMRGIYTFGSGLGTDKGVSLYIDGVYVQAATGSIFEFADIEQIEVLRGPQGTLFGRNSTGGAVSIRTRRPTGEFGIRQELTSGNYSQFRSKSRIDLPRVGPLSLSLSYLHSERDGDTRNLGAGTVWNHGPASGGVYGLLRSPERLGDENVDGVFVAADFDFHPDFDLSYKFDLSDTDFTPPATGVAYLATPATAALGGTPPSTTPYMFYLASPNVMTPVTTKRPDAVNNWFNSEGSTETYGHNLTATWQINDWATLKNILAYRETSLYTNSQLDGLGGLIVPTSRVPFLFVANNVGVSEKQWSDELQLNLSRDRFNLTAGLIHFQNDQETSGIAGEFNSLQGAAMVGQGTSAPGPFVVPANTGYVRPRVKAKSDAFYIQPEIHLNDQLDFVVGYRITKDKKDGTEIVPGTVQPYSPSLGRSSPIRYDDERGTYLVGLNYTPTSNLLAYLKYATGYISGGQLATIVFAPETARSYEAGIKTEFLDRRLRSNIAVYHVDYGSIQQTALGAQTGIPSSIPFGQAIIPSADATAYGFEWENTLVPIDRLMLGVNVGYTHFEFDDDTVFPGYRITHGVPGFQEFNRPEWTGSLFAQYNGPRVFADGHLSARVDGQFRSEYLMTSDTSPGSGLTAQEDPLLRDSATAPDQWLVNARLALSGLRIGGATVEVSLWGRNVFDNRNIIQYAGLGFAGTVIYERARTFGVDLVIEF